MAVRWRWRRTPPRAPLSPHQHHAGEAPAVPAVLDMSVMMEASLQYAVGGMATAFCLPTPTTAVGTPAPPVRLSSSPAPGDLSSPTGRRLPSPRRSLISSWLSGGGEYARHQNSVQVQTETLHAPLQSFENAEQGAAGGATQAAGLAGLLCLERPLPAEIFRGLEHLAKDSSPFKVEVLRVGDRPPLAGIANKGGWVDALTSSFEPRGRESKHDHRLDSAQQLLLAEEAQEVVRWLTKDIERVASLFARQASVFSAAAVSSSELTVKLELLNKGKCPRFHLDKVPMRLICTYVGPSTVWLDGYDKREMETNRSPPPVCNPKISGGREARHAGPGDVLIFRGQPNVGQVEGGALAVAHRSPDTVEGQRRLVLTIDVGDLTSSVGQGRA